ncbi:MAG: aminoacyl-tRNA hydrolase [Bacteroidales bacterium]|nr:aminoacyl-tRNA hydrolase [Bacteroidales bacterium]
MKYLIAGLGNIGAEYAATRHNLGFMVLDALAAASNISFTPDRYGSIAELRLKGHTVTLLKPSTYMNLSGKAVSYWVKKLNIPLENLLVVVDDLALPFGTIRIRKKGSAGGHNGLKSIDYSLISDEYPRMRMGIGNGFAPGGQIDFVLGELMLEEKRALPELLERAGEAVKGFVLEGVDRTMNKFNTSKQKPKEQNHSSSSSSTSSQPPANSAEKSE